VTNMINTRKKCNAHNDALEKAICYKDHVLPYFNTIRYHCDKLELLIDDRIWPLTKYRELLFMR